jgi:hypothetical protein
MLSHQGLSIAERVSAHARRCGQRHGGTGPAEMTWDAELSE